MYHFYVICFSKFNNKNGGPVFKHLIQLDNTFYDAAF